VSVEGRGHEACALPGSNMIPRPLRVIAEADGTVKIAVSAFAAVADLFKDGDSQRVSRGAPTAGSHKARLPRVFGRAMAE